MKRSTWLGLLVLFLAIGPMLPTVANVYNFDDETLVGENESIIHPNLKLYFGPNTFGVERDNALYRPVLMLTLAANRVVFGHEAVFYHLINVLLHGISALLLFVFLLRVAQNLFAAFVAAALFATHPVHVDAVAFVINRSEMLGVLFLLISALALTHVRSLRSLFGSPVSSDAVLPTGRFTQGFWWTLSLTSFATALLSKESAAAFLPLMVLFFWPPGKSRPAATKVIIAFSLVFAMYALTRLLVLGSFSAEPSTASIYPRNVSTLFSTVSRIFLKYLELVIAPFHLRVDYSDFRVSHRFFDPEAVVAYVVHGALFLAAFFFRYKRPLYSLLILAFYVSLLPVSHLFPFRDILAERFLYLPSLFILVLLAFSLSDLRIHHQPKTIATGCAALLIILYSSLTLSYSNGFASKKALWSSMLDRRPTNPKFSYNLGVSYADEADCVNAIPLFQQAIKLSPQYEDAYLSLGRCQVATKEKDLAEVSFLTAVRINEKNAKAHRYLATFYFLAGRTSSSKQHAVRAVQLAPHDPKTREMVKLISNTTP